MDGVQVYRDREADIDPDVQPRSTQRGFCMLFYFQSGIWKIAAPPRVSDHGRKDTDESRATTSILRVELAAERSTEIRLVRNRLEKKSESTVEQSDSSLASSESKAASGMGGL